MTPTRDDAVSFHDDIAHKWESGYRTDTFSVRLRVLSALVPSAQTGRRWLDAGCGTGTLARWLATERGAEVVALDAAEQMIANAPPSPGVEFRQGDVTATGLAAGSFDGVVCSSVVEYLDHPEDALREFHRLLKPGGQLVLSVPNASLTVRAPLWAVYWMTRPLGKRRWFTFLDHSKHAYDEPRLHALLDRAGFSPTETVFFGRLDLPLRLHVPLVSPLIMTRARRRAD
jgi:2-polyprenyl-6-hydroxyphenyl methylase/3-demethylubiquinone-9 3-methyltransferase